MNRPIIGARWFYCGQDWRAKRDQLLDFVDALRPIHPLLEQFSDRGNRSGWQRMLKEPLLQDMTDAQWQEALRYEDLFLFRNFNVWNRRTTNTESLVATLHYSDPVPGELVPFKGSGLSLPRLPDSLVTEPVLAAMLEAAITAFRPDHALLATFFRVAPSLDESTISETELQVIRQRAQDERRPDVAEWRERAMMFDGGLDTPVWRLWIASGRPWPKSGSTWLETWQSEPADEEMNRLGGTFYTWRRYAPWNLPDESDWKRPAG